MSHKNIIYDSDPHFKINAITRQISNSSSTKTTLIQNDHNSERFTFEVDRFIEGHDMAECNRVEVHYNNNGNEDVYEVDDVQISQNNDDTIVFSWLLSNNATQNEGKLEFSIRFACTSEDGIVDYAWNTAIFSGVSISKGMNNTEAVAKVISDIIAKWKEELKPGGGGVTSYTDLTDKPITVLDYYPTNEQLEQMGEGIYLAVVQDYTAPDYMYFFSTYEDWEMGNDSVEYKHQSWTVTIIGNNGIRVKRKDNFRGFQDGRESYTIDWREVPLYDSAITKSNLVDDIDVVEGDEEFDAVPSVRGLKIALVKNATDVVGYVDRAIGNIETSLENIIAKYGLGGDSV